MLVHRSPKQEEFGLPVNKRFRGKSLKIQLQIALNDAQKAMKAEISVQKLVQARIAALTTLINKQHKGKLEKALAAVERLTAENEKLKSELAAALAKPAVVRPPTPAELVLQNYEREKGGAS